MELIWDNPFFEWSNGYRLRKNDNESDVTGTTRTEDNIFSRIRVQEGPFVPQVDLQYEWFHQSDNLLDPKLDSNENEVKLDIEKNLLPFIVRYEFKADRFDNDINQIIEDRIDHLGDVSFDRRFLNGVVSTSVNYQIDASRRIARRPPFAETVSVSREPDRALHLRQDDESPPDGNTTNDVLVDLGTSSSLIDGDTNTKATGTGGADISLDDDEQNLGLRFSINVEIDTIFIYIVDEIPPALESTLDAIRWEVFTGTSSSNWAPPVVGVSSDFNPIESRFEITFPSVTTRFIRVRNIDLTTGEAIFVTEVEAQGLAGEDLSIKRRQVRETYDQDLTTRVTLQPLRFLSFTHDLFYTKVNVEPEDAEDIERSNTGTMPNALTTTWMGRTTLLRLRTVTPPV
jgi:hypothetical protein